ncbi:sulfotransferase [Novosphingobium sp. MMS21-SN21R]|uniref:sulfotransferase family protein n=1 Tax=Novosphingobium sp. MMS21-SN21R TaxID=2969298 RepID=UPI0028864AC3|nr:sulfotransferase [Novosphingobium sp. MMS21-SN21R]MDT0506448.1 sulfotransferase [Novosphingobium sp. MMS21-SN21R]
MTEDQAITQLRAFVAALESGNRRAANAAAFALIEGNPALGDRWQSIAKVMQTNGEYSGAHLAMERYAHHRASDPHARFLQAAMLAQTGNLEQAWKLMGEVPFGVPTVSGHQYIRGTIAVNLGDVEEAERSLLAALDSEPQLGQAMLSLAAARKRKAGDAIGDRIIAAEPAMEGAPALERAHYHYAAGRVHFDRKEPDAAFRHFAAGADLVKGWRPYDAATDASDAAECRDGFDRAFVESVNARVTIQTDTPIFVTGLPRSGTTLVEQILVSHSAVAGGEELGRMSVLLRDLPSPGAKGLAGYLNAGGRADDLAALYIHLGQERFGKQGRFVDKALNTSRFMGLIASLLPQAKVVWMRRDPADCAWSAYRTYFIHGLDWSWDLEDIAAHFALEDELFRHWSAMFPDRILVVDYQSLVQDPEPQIRRILAHCGLAEEPQVFRPHETKRIVSTASVMQVREPINTGAVGAADAYRTRLAPFTERYAALVADAQPTR